MRRRTLALSAFSAGREPRRLRRALRTVLPLVLLLSAGCLEFDFSKGGGDAVDQPAYGVPGEELPITIYGYLPGTADGVQGYAYMRMRDNWTVKYDTLDFVSESRVLAGQIAYDATRASNAETNWGSPGGTYWWGGTSGAFDVQAAENITITGTVVVSGTETPGNLDIDYALGSDQQQFTSNNGESFNIPIAIGDLRVALGEKAPTDQNATASQQDVVMTQLKVRAGVGAGSYTVTAIAFTHQGTAGAMANVSSARLYRDNNSDGKLQAGGDALLATINSPGTTMNFTGFNSVVTGGAAGHFLVVYNFNGATVGHTYAVRTAPGSLTVTGAPTVVGPPNVDSNTTTISNSASVSVALGDNNPTDTWQVVGAAAQDRTLLQLAFSAGTVDDVSLHSLTVTFTEVGGQAFESNDVADIRLYRDNDGDGVLDDGSDPQVGETRTWSRTGTDTNLTFNPADNDNRVVSAGTTVNFIVVIDLSGNGSSQENIMARLTGSGNVDTRDSGGGAVTCTGTFPIGGTQTNILNDLIINFDPNGVAFAAGSNDPGASERTPSDTDIVTMQTKIQAPSGQKATLNDLVLWNDGTTTGQTDISAVRFYRDFNGDGLVNGSDYEVASGSFNTYPPAAPDANGCRIQVSGGYDISAGEEHVFLFVLDLSGNGSADETIELRLLDPSDYTDISGDVTVGATPTEANLYTGPVLQEASTITLKSSTLTVALGDSTPPAKGILAGAQKESVLQVKLTAGALASVTVTQIKFDGSGTGDEANDITTVHLYNDVNSNGEYDAGTDLSIGSGTYDVSGVVTFSGLSEVINAGQTENWLLVYDMAGTASNSETFQAQVASSSSITCAGSVAVGGPPVVSNTLTIQGVGTLTFTAGAGNPASGDVDRGATDVVTLHLVATANGIEDIDISEITLAHSGTATNPDLVDGSIELYHDVDGDGVLTGADEQVGSSLSDPASMTFTFGAGNEVRVSAGDSEKFILVMSIEAAATVGDTLKESLDEPGDVTAAGVSSGQPVGKTGAPSGGTLTITNQPTLTVSTGDQNPGADYIQSNEQDVGMVQVKLTAGSGGNVNVTAIKFKAAGAGDDRSQAAGGDLANGGVSLYVDANDNGQYDSGTDVPQLGSSGNYTADNGTITFSGFSRTINASSSEQWIVVYDLRDPGTASSGETFQAILQNPAADVTATVTPAGSGVSGGVKTIAAVTSITWNGSVSSNFNLPGNYDEAVGPGPSIDVSVPNVTTEPVVSASGSAKALTVAVNSSVKVEGGKALNCYGNVTLNGTLELEANSTLRLADTASVTAGAGSTFQVSGTSQLAGGYATIEAVSGNYTMTLSGNVDVSFARIYDLANAGLTLSSSGATTVFEHVTFDDLQSAGGTYLHVTDVVGTDWKGYEFIGLGFGEVGAGPNTTGTVEIDIAGEQVTFTGYAADASAPYDWSSGTDSDTETAGTIVWTGTGARVSAFGSERGEAGARVTWREEASRDNAAYAVSRRVVERFDGLLESERRASVRRETWESERVARGTWTQMAVHPAAPAGAGRGLYEMTDATAPLAVDDEAEYRLEAISGRGQLTEVGRCAAAAPPAAPASTSPAPAPVVEAEPDATPFAPLSPPPPLQPDVPVRSAGQRRAPEATPPFVPPPTAVVSQAARRVPRVPVRSRRLRERLAELEARLARADAAETRNANVLRVETELAGLVRVSAESLAAAGIDPTGEVVVYRRGGREEAARAADGSVVLAARAHANAYTGRESYWLADRPLAPGAAALLAEIAALRARLGETEEGEPVAAGDAPSIYTALVRNEVDAIYISGLPGAAEGEEHWFAGWMTPGRSHAWSVAAASPLASGRAEVTVRLRGGMTALAPDPDHVVTVSLNGVEVGEAAWSGYESRVARFEVDAALVREGGNEVRTHLEAQAGAPYDFVFADWAELAYPRQLNAINNRLDLEVEADAGALVRVAGFAPEDEVFAFDVTGAPKRLAAANENGTVEFRTIEAGARRYAVASASGAAAPARVRVLDGEAVAAAVEGATDYLAVAPAALAGELAPLLEDHAAHGLATRLVALENAYDAGGWGRAEPESLRKLAARLEVKHVLLAGDATSDMRFRLSAPGDFYLPSWLVQGPSFENASDGRYGDLDGDGLPEAAVGRLPARSAADLATIVAKARARLAAAPEGYGTERAVLVADQESGAFESAMDEAESSLAGWKVERLNVAAVGVAAARTETKRLWETNPGYLGYLGHGGLGGWGWEIFFAAGDVSGLAPAAEGEALPVVVQGSCLTGAYNLWWGSDSIAETMLKAPGRGASAVVCHSGFTAAEGQTQLVKALFRRLAGGDTVGEALVAAKRSLGASHPDVRESFNLLGDPAAR